MEAHANADGKEEIEEVKEDIEQGATEKDANEDAE